MSDPTTVVDAFMAAICDKDLERAVTFCTDDVTYDNVPIGAVKGHDGIREVLGGFMAGSSQVDWVVHHQVAAGDVVMNERLDRFEMAHGWVEIRVAGLFVLTDGKISVWRDYFDMAMLQSQLGG
ncbi:MAG: limonene-1,2-epoxide hydrolase family protein [Actinomycetota bacterium]|nr:limonene-1,2-epoxide hydrolase family protein [Actinomycetota bacterium]